MELIKLRGVYETVYRNRKFSTMLGNHECSRYVFSVTFQYAVKPFNQVRNGVYVRYDVPPDEVEITDGACVRGGELIACRRKCLSLRP